MDDDEAIDVVAMALCRRLLVDDHGGKDFDVELLGRPLKGAEMQRVDPELYKELRRDAAAVLAALAKAKWTP
jgi:hypothetical protein